MADDTIFALGSGRPPAAIGLIRISGPGAHAAAERIAGRLPKPRRAALRQFRHPETGELLDQGMVLRFDGAASSTGEDLVELHCHGGRAVIDALLGVLGGVEGLRQAEPGEFTRRAFENGRIDLTEAEGLADLLEAETEIQRKAAMAIAEGGLRRQIERWQQRLLELSARGEAAIDYVDEYDNEAEPTLYRDCDALSLELRGWLGRPRTEPLKRGILVVCAGPPNAGKSRLINEIVGEEKVIVTDVPGTTRDAIEVPVSLAGMPLLLTDTAGLRDTEEQVERIGINRARTLVDRADILLWLGEPADAPPHPRLVLVHARADLPGRQDAPDGSLAVSAVTGEGISYLLERIAELAGALLPGDDSLALNRRQAQHLGQAAEALGAAARSGDLVIAAESLRAARAAFDRLTGRAGMEDVLDALFGRFCLGK